MNLTRGHALAALLACVATATVAGCGDDAADTSTDLDPATASVIYHYNDASVAPEYHRSYTVTVTQGTARVVVDAYGDVLHDVTEPIDDALWERTLAAAQEFDDASSSDRDSGCSGGTSEELTVANGEVVAFDVFVDHCDSSGGANVVEAVGEVLPLFDMDAMLATE